MAHAFTIINSSDETVVYTDYDAIDLTTLKHVIGFIPDIGTLVESNEILLESGVFSDEQNFITEGSLSTIEVELETGTGSGGLLVETGDDVRLEDITFIGERTLTAGDNLVLDGHDSSSTNDAADTAGYATLSPDGPRINGWTYGGEYLSAGNLYYTGPGGYTYITSAFIIPKSGKWGFQAIFRGPTISGSGNDQGVGLATENTTSLSNAATEGNIIVGWSGDVYKNDSILDNGTALAVDDVVEFLIDVDADTLEYIVEGSSRYTSTSVGLTNGEDWFPSGYTYANQLEFDFGQSGYEPSDTDYLTLNTDNLPSVPTSINLDSTTVDENAAGAVVGNITVTDPNVGDTHSFTVSDARFEVVGGQLKLKAAESLDFETELSVTVDITATDSTTLSLTQSFVISVGDENSTSDNLMMDTPDGKHKLVPEDFQDGEENHLVLETASDTNIPNHYHEPVSDPHSETETETGHTDEEHRELALWAHKLDLLMARERLNAIS